MGDLPDTSRPLPVPRTGKPITSQLLETYLACQIHDRAATRRVAQGNLAGSGIAARDLYSV